VEKQVMIIYAATHGYLDDLPPETVHIFEKEFYPYVEKEYPDVGHSIGSTKDLDEKTEQKLNQALSAFKEQFKSRLAEIEKELACPPGESPAKKE